jgi:hypothetical protein
MSPCFFLGTTALVVGLLASSAASAQPRDDIDLTGFGWRVAPDPGWSDRHRYRCWVWDGYRWVNMCYRGRAYVTPPWMRFHR